MAVAEDAGTLGLSDMARLGPKRQEACSGRGGERGEREEDGN